MKRFLLFVVFLGFFGIAGFVFVNYYSYLFAVRVIGEVINVERVEAPMTILSNRPDATLNPQIFSFAIAIRDQKTSEIFTASSEDRQWAVVQTGQCAEVKIFPYPPWNFDRSGTYYNARLEKLYDCPLKSQ